MSNIVTAVSESELEDIVKAGQTMMLPPEGLGVGRGSSSSTQALIGDYSSSFQGLNGGNTGLRAPLRTPLQENIIMQEARNQRAFRDMTPLAGKMLYLSPSSSLSHGTNYMKHVVQHCFPLFTFSNSATEFFSILHGYATFFTIFSRLCLSFCVFLSLSLILALCSSF